MKLDFQAKFLQHLNQKKQQDEGFTLIELLVVIIIIGILAAIALPSLLGQVNKAKQSEAKNNIGALNRAQQAYQLEYSEFATGLTQLGIGIKSQTVNYQYTIELNGSQVLVNKGTAVKPALKSYAGLVATITGDPTTGEVLTIAAACESVNPTTDPFSVAVDADTVNNATAPCGSTDWKSLGK
ncbi:MAG TPA: type IV pilin-like G/H family protein [Leptolyngbyaceae cyanobacterium]